VERGATIAGAAGAAGVAVSTAYHRRRTCAAFAQAWDGAVAKSSGCADAGADPAALPAAATAVRGHKGRGLIRKRKRPVEFDRERRQAFLF
jgi:hypothetical protein